jgi:hypothetical protein
MTLAGFGVPASDRPLTCTWFTPSAPLLYRILLDVVMTYSMLIISYDIDFLKTFFHNRVEIFSGASYYAVYERTTPETLTMLSMWVWMVRAARAGQERAASAVPVVP